MREELILAVREALSLLDKDTEREADTVIECDVLFPCELIVELDVEFPETNVANEACEDRTFEAPEPEAATVVPESVTLGVAVVGTPVRVGSCESSVGMTSSLGPKKAALEGSKSGPLATSLRVRLQTNYRTVHGSQKTAVQDKHQHTICLLRNNSSHQAHNNRHNTNHISRLELLKQ